ECATRVARRAGVAVAYASAGRGDDLRGVVHEWAGEPDGVLACMEALCGAGVASLCLAAATEEAPIARLRAAGAAGERAPFAWLRAADLADVWSALTAGAAALADVQLHGAPERTCLTGANGSVVLSHDEALALLFGPERPARAAAALSPAQFLALRAALPWPLFLWGFDAL
ncbi:MAG: hypothetical protein DCC71_20710, partial [Proteobacteria bacterium]